MKRNIRSIISTTVICAMMSAVLRAGAIEWGLSFRNGVNQPPSGEQSVEALAKYGAYFMGDAAQKTIYLTFDCGYENGNTASILDTLKKHHAPATFFIVGHYVESVPDLVQRMTAEGHLVGNHSTNHPNMMQVSSERFGKELSTLETQYQQLTGRTLAPFFRPPEGVYDQTTLQRAQALGYHTTLWSVAYVDWDERNQPSRESALKTLNSRIHNGAIVLLHVTSRTNAAILDELLTQWKAKGYRFAALSELPGMPNPTVTAVPSAAVFTVDGKPTAFEAFTIADNNYVKLRDFAAALQDTDKLFGVHYDAGRDAVSMLTGQAYERIGRELQGAANVAALQMRASKQPVLIDNSPTNMSAYSVHNVNYLKLRDLAEALNVQVSWDSATGAISLTT